LVYLDCSEYHLRSLDIKGCKSLEVLDDDMNNLDKKSLNFPKLPKLKSLSLKLNSSTINTYNRKTVLTLRSPKLKYLVYDGSNISKPDHVLGLKNKERTTASSK